MFGFRAPAGSPRDRALLLARVAAEARQQPSPTPPHMPLYQTSPRRPRLRCRECTEEHAVRASGRIWAHRVERVGPNGRYRANERCPGSGEPPLPDLLKG